MTKPPGSVLDDGRIVTRKAGAVPYGSVYIRRVNLLKAIQHGWSVPPPSLDPDDLIQVIKLPEKQTPTLGG